MSETANTTSEPVTLRRSLGLWDLILYGIIVIQPTAPMPVFGVIYTVARGHVVTAILLAMFAMLLTAFSYGHMARLHPQAGSAFTYVGKEIHPSAGYLAGWCMAMDYVLNPLDLHHLVQQSSAELCSRHPLHCVGSGFRHHVHRAEPERRRDFSAHERGTGGGARCGHPDVCSRGDPLRGPQRYIGRLAQLHPAVLRSRNVFRTHRPAWHVARGADLHRVRRHYHIVRGGAQSASAMFLALWSSPAW